MYIGAKFWLIFSCEIMFCFYSLQNKLLTIKSCVIILNLISTTALLMKHGEI